MKNKFSISMSLAVIVAMLVTSLALAAELVTAEVTGTANDVTVTQGTSVTSTINLSATGTLSCSITSTTASTATIDTLYSLNSAGALTTSSPSSAFKFYSDGVVQGGSSNCGVTWDTASTPYSVTVTISAAATTPVGNYTVTLQDSSAGTTDTADITNPAVSGGKLGDVTPTTITVHVVAPVVTDSTAPVITPNIVGTPGNSGWYVSDVTVSWSVVDNESAISSSNGCETTTINTDTPNWGTTLTCTATSAGGTSSQSVTIQRDATPPIILAQTSGTPNGNGWYNEDVTVGFSCQDGTSYLALCPSLIVLGEGANQSATATAYDVAGNSASATVSGINIDRTAPTATATATPPANGNGWNNTNVTVSFSGIDGLSGIDSCNADVVLANEGADQPVSGTCTDEAGNVSAPATAKVSIDKTAPQIAFVGPSTSAWYNTDVTANWSCTDGLSGPANASVSATTSGQGAAQPATGTCADLAGNSSSDTQSFKVDKTAPSLSPSVSPNPVLLNGTATASANASDSLSGLASSSCGAVDTSSVGSHSVTCTATDNAGNTNSASTSYSVIYNWSGFFQPIDNNGVFNSAKAGSTVPVKFSLGGDQGLSILMSGYPKITLVACSATATVDTIEELSTATVSGLKYDVLANQYIYNWKTQSTYATKCYMLTVKLIDGTEHTALFKFTK